ncbi:hypothetical protein RB195_007209 [Necator americanus]|uniref:Uncharacterized protein n=1 Tax=Necator americanus TaxID=51031 RepID=A0ABR1BXU6_NECAM
MHGSSAESTKDDVQAERMGLGCPIHAQRNEHIRMHQLRLSGSGTEHDRGCSEEDQKHPALCSPSTTLTSSTPPYFLLRPMLRKPGHFASRKKTR